MTAPQERPVAGDGLDREAVRRLLDDLWCPTPVISPESWGGGDIREVRCGDCTWCRARDALEAAEAEVARLRAFLQHLADLPIADGQHYAPTCGCAVHEAAVAAMAEALYAERYGGDAPGEDAYDVAICRGLSRHDARAALAALVASAEVREGLSRVAEERLLEDDHIPGFAARADRMAVAILAAIAGPEAS